MTEVLDKGDPNNWAELSEEERRCLDGLYNYWTKVDNKEVEDATLLAWEDLKHEFPHLQPFPWYKTNE